MYSSETLKTKDLNKPVSTVSSLLPLYGCLLFLLLYFIAAVFYPGGTYSNKNSVGFSWTENYWCNLLSETALNGQYNSGWTIAFAAMIILCITLMIFWYLFPAVAGFDRTWRYTIRASGFIAMSIAMFIYTDLHDTVINVAGVFGLIALGGTLAGLKKLKWQKLFYMGLMVILLIGLNNLLYYRKDLMIYLPVVQKITFIYFLLWICLINLRWQRKKAATINVRLPS